MTEDQTLAAYFDWVRWMANQDQRYELIVHVPNEGDRGKWGQIWAKKKGLSKGFPDVLCLARNALYNGFAMEAKSAKGRLTSEQTDWLNRLHNNHFACVVRRTFDDMKAFTETYMRIGR